MCKKKGRKCPFNKPGCHHSEGSGSGVPVHASTVRALARVPTVPEPKDSKDFRRTAQFATFRRLGGGSSLRLLSPKEAPPDLRVSFRLCAQASVDSGGLLARGIARRKTALSKN